MKWTKHGAGKSSSTRAALPMMSPTHRHAALVSNMAFELDANMESG